MSTRVTIATTLDEATAVAGEFRAGGTDLQERRRSGLSRGPLVDIHSLPGLNQITWNDKGAARIGTLVTVAAIAANKKIQQHYPGLTQAAGALATPQIRTLGTIGGNLLQQTRCWYYRHPDVDCYKSGGDHCPARTGNHLYGVCFDLGPCVHPHPSTLGMALMAYDAQVEVHGQEAQPVADLYGDGSDPGRDHLLGEGQLLTHIQLPPPLSGERANYFRAISRARAEWPLVEALARVQLDGQTIAKARVAVGGVANVPLRLSHVEDALEGQPVTAETLEQAADLATEGATPLLMTGYKVGLLRNTVLETLERTVQL